MPPVPRRCLPRAESAHRPLTPPVTTSSASFGAPPAARTAFPAASSKAAVPNDPGRLPSTSAHIGAPPLSRRDPSSASPPPIPRLCRPGPASDALSPPRSGEEVARPRPLPGALHARALLGHAPLVDFCNRIRSTSTTSDLETRSVWRPRGFRRAPRPRDRSALRRGHRRFPDGDSADAEPRIHGSGAVWMRDLL